MTQESPPSDPPQDSLPAPVQSLELRGTPVAPGLALGPVHRKDYDLDRVQAQRVPLDAIEAELNRFHSSLRESKRQLDELKDKLKGKVPSDHIRILDTHVAYLCDSVFLSDVENLILNEQMSLEAAIAKVISDFDRIFRLVENELLRERAVDLRDVGIRVLRNLEELKPEDETEAEPQPLGDYILVARELSIVDMFHLGGLSVLGIITEEGGLTSHAAILARSMGVPCLTAVEGLREQVAEGDFVILDASEGRVLVNPDDVVRAQYREASADHDRSQAPEGAVQWKADSFQTKDGTQIAISANCGNLPEVTAAAAAHLAGVGLYRTELLYLIDKQQPSLESLIAHYTAIAREFAGKEVTFRLLDLDSSFQVDYLHEQREPNPALGCTGVRALLAQPAVLRRQLEAILRAAVEGSAVRILVPFVIDASEIRRVKEAFFEVRMDLQRARHPLPEKLEFGAVIETPAAAMGARALCEEVDFLVVSYDSLTQYLLACDRDQSELSERFDSIHPVVLRVLQAILEAAQDEGTTCTVTDVGATRPAILPFLVGAGTRRFALPSVILADVQRSLASFTLERATEASSRAIRAACQADCLSLSDSFVRAFDTAEEHR